MGQVVNLRQRLSTPLAATAVLTALAMLLVCSVPFYLVTERQLQQRAEGALAELPVVLRRSAGQLHAAMSELQQASGFRQQLRGAAPLLLENIPFHAALLSETGALLWQSGEWQGAPLLGEQQLATLLSGADVAGYWLASDRVYQLLFRHWPEVPERILVLGRALDPPLFSGLLTTSGLQLGVFSADGPVVRISPDGEAGVGRRVGQHYLLSPTLAGQQSLRLEILNNSEWLPSYWWLMCLGVLLLAPLLAWWVAQRHVNALAKPLAVLTKQLQAYGEGQPIEGLAVRSNTEEILGLSYAFDSMLGLLRRREENLRYRATHDLLTGMKNQNELLRIVSQRISEARTFDRPFHVVGININNFREINDVFGPDIADACLVNIGAYLECENLVAARFYRGGIAVVKEGVADDVAAVVLAMQLSRHHGISKLDIELNVCTGIVGFPSDADNAETLLRRLEITLDSARRAPYNFHRYKPGQEEDYVKRLSLVEQLRVAMIDWHAGLQMFYQPKLNLGSGRIERMEALIRWQHPEHGAISPDHFIPLAEQAGLIGALSNWVIAQVCAQLALWREHALDLQVAVNLSVQDIVRPDMLDVIEAQRKKYDLPASVLAFEITETELMENPGEAIRLLNKFRAAGYGLAIDDFGTGYSSLSQVKNMPVNEIKIDREFVRQLRGDENDQKIVRTTLALAGYFDLEAVAEGVEDAASLHMLSEWGCQWAQGYYISPPMPGVDVRQWVESFHEGETLPLGIAPGEASS